MAAPQDFGWTFRHVRAFGADRAVFVTGHDESAATDLPVSGIFYWAGQWICEPIPIIAISVTVTSGPKPNVLALGRDGTVMRWGTDPPAEEWIDNSTDGPQNLGDLREIRTIESRAYVVGMRRTVYRCDGPRNWTRIDAGARTPDDDESDAGFDSIDGFGESEIYAAGWDGEVWRFDGTNWAKIESPTNLAIHRVVCGGDGNCYGCGQEGVIVRGRGSVWSIVAQDETDDTFWGAAWFRDRLYLSTANGIFSLRDDTLVPVDIKPKSRKSKIKLAPGLSFYKLDSNEHMLWSAGEKLVLYTDDGEHWAETDYDI